MAIAKESAVKRILQHIKKLRTDIELELTEITPEEVEDLWGSSDKMLSDMLDDVNGEEV